MTQEIAIEMMEALNSDNEMSISNIDGYEKEIAQALYEALTNPLQKTAYNRDYAKSCPICGSKFLYVKTYKDKLGKYYCKECDYDFA